MHKYGNLMALQALNNINLCSHINYNIMSQFTGNCIYLFFC